MPLTQRTPELLKPGHIIAWSGPIRTKGLAFTGDSSDNRSGLDFSFMEDNINDPTLLFRQLYDIDSFLPATLNALGASQALIDSFANNDISSEWPTLAIKFSLTETISFNATQNTDQLQRTIKNGTSLIINRDTPVLPIYNNAEAEARAQANPDAILLSGRTILFSQTFPEGTPFPLDFNMTAVHGFAFYQ